MASIDNLNIYFCSIIVFLLLFSVLKRLAFKELRLSFIDLYFICVLLACVVGFKHLLETMIFVGVGAPLFRDTARYQQNLSRKLLSFSVLSINAVTFYALQNQILGSWSLISMAWILISFLFVMPSFSTQPEADDRVKTNVFYHLNLRLLAGLFAVNYLDKSVLNLDVVTISTGALFVGALISLFVKKLVVTKSTINFFLTGFIYMVALSFPESQYAILFLTAAALYFMDYEGASFLSHSRNHIKMLEWVSWISPTFVVLLYVVLKQKSDELYYNISLVALVIAIGALATFRPANLETKHSMDARLERLLVFKSIFLASLIVIAERYL